MLELLCIFVLLAYLASKFHQRELKQVESPDSAAAARNPEPPTSRLRLAIAGTQRAYLRNKSFVHGYGVSPHAVHDLRTYSHTGRLETFPSAIIAPLRELYERGNALGTDVMALLFHGRSLKEGEAVYFALVDAKPEPRVVAFVDKLRLS